ncbi:MAG TPA: dihydrodipicolinate reductase C-terminal domain-containing protein [Vicinamibacterales bacterium]|nr:dihydrodipicolinate reductase C-terminal domain-containing protein [Vicinamibacterales bacterium]
MTNLVLVGHGRMGQLIERLAAEHGCRVAGVVTQASARDLATRDFGPVDVAIDFSLAPAVKTNLAAMAGRKWNVVIGTTGWQNDLDACRSLAAKAGIGVLASANFSIGVHIFTLIAAEAARRFAAIPNVGAWIHESHHAAKKDAPSGTAVMLRTAMELAGYGRPIDVSSTRAGSIPGTHRVGFDAPTESVSLVHEVRDRAVFAHGALEAAQWLKGRSGWFGMDDMVGR